MKAHACLLTLGALIPVSAPRLGQNLLYDLTEPGVAMFVDQSIGACGDVNGDGLPDFLIGVPKDSTVETDAGAVRVHSGADAALMLEVFGFDDFHNLGYALDGAGDVNADGVPDFLVGTGFTTANYAEVRSGTDGSVLHHVAGDLRDVFGTAVTGLGDVDADGFDDFAVGAPGLEAATGYASVFSGHSGGLLAKKTGACLYSEFGLGIDGLGDINGDGLPEVAVVQPATHPDAACAGVVNVFDQSGALLHSFPTETPQFAPPSKVAGTGDVDADGSPDMLVVFPGLSSCSTAHPGSLKVYSGLTGNVVLQYGASLPGCIWNFRAADGVGDLNGDGREDVAVGMSKPDIGDPGYHVDVISGLDTATLATFWSPTSAYYGNGVVGLGDLNGDGQLEVGATGAGAWIHSTCSGVAAKYGAACPGAGGFKPKLAATGCPNPGQTIVLHITNGHGGQPAFLAVGTGEAQVPIGGSCSLLVAPLLLVQPLGILFDFGPGWGNRDVPIVLPPGTSGLTLTFQAAHLDPLVPTGFAVTNAVRIDVQ